MDGLTPRDNSVRPAAVAGQFYPAQPASLRRMIEDAFLSPLGPGALPVVCEGGMRNVLGIVVPHAGYPYSGQGAAWGFDAVARDGKPRAVIMLGVNHRGIGAPIAISPAAFWETPLGILPVDGWLCERLRQLEPRIEADARSHAGEHSLEVQAPFLQYLYEDSVPIIPILIGRASESSLIGLGRALAEVAREEDVLLLASSDCSHYVSQSEAAMLDRLAMDQVVKLSGVGLLDTVRENGITMCGVFPVAALLFAAQELDGISAEVVHYHTSGDVTGDRRQVVGYATAVLRRSVANFGGHA